MYRTKLQATLDENRPNVKPATISSYISTLYNLPLKVDTEMTKSSRDDLDPIEYYTIHKEEIHDYLMENVSDNRRRSIWSAIYILTGDKNAQSQMIEDIGAVNEKYKNGESSEREKENWISWPDILDVYQTRKEVIDLILRPSKKAYNPTEFNKINDFVALSCYVLQEPRRLEWCSVKLRNYDPKNDNFIDMSKRVIVFNKYKTSDVYGSQTITMSNGFYTLLTKWMVINDTNDYLLNRKDVKLQPTALTRILNKTFSPLNVSCDMLRHSYLTHMFGPMMAQMKETAQNMSHSTEMQQMYVRPDNVSQISKMKAKK